MKLILVLSLLVSLVLVLTIGVRAQQGTDAAKHAEDLRAQLLEVQAKETDLQERARRLDEDLKPENIERAVAGAGSTRPEELREQRRHQLEIEKKSVLTQLEIVAKNRANLESAILRADAEAYQQSARGTNASSLDQMFIGRLPVPRGVGLLLVVLVAAVAAGGLVVVLRRLSS